MKIIGSRISFFILTALLLGGFPNFMAQEAFAYTISTAVIDDPDNGNIVVDAADTILIDFGLATNATASGTMTKAEITANFTTSGNLFDGAITGSWENAAGTGSNQFLKITLGTGAAGTVGDTITYALSGTDGGIFNLAESDEADATAITTTGDFGVVAAAAATNNGGGSGCDDCEAPTLGVDKNGFRHVSNGFTYNGHSVDAERFFTPYPLITANVGKTNTADFKLYENQGISNIRHFTLAFGMDKGDIISDSKAKIELDIDHEGTETVTVTDPENALDNVQVTTSTVSCTDDSYSECLGISIQHRFRAPLDFNIVATDTWDTKRNSWQNYFNHGIEIVGESLNPAKEYDGINKGHIYHLTETSKTTAVDEFGNSWTLKHGLWNKDIQLHKSPVTLFLNKIIPTDNGFAGSDQFGSMYYLTETSTTTAVDLFGNTWSFDGELWTMDYIYSRIILDSTPMGGYTRVDSEFDTFKYEQSVLAENKLNEICSECSDKSFGEIENIFFYTYP